MRWLVGVAAAFTMPARSLPQAIHGALKDGQHVLACCSSLANAVGLAACTRHACAAVAHSPNAWGARFISRSSYCLSQYGWACWSRRGALVGCGGVGAWQRKSTALAVLGRVRQGARAGEGRFVAD